MITTNKSPHLSVSGGMVGFGQFYKGGFTLKDGQLVSQRLDEHANLRVAQHESVRNDIQSYRTDVSFEQEVELTQKKSKVAYIKGVIAPGASDNTRFFVHVLDRETAPLDGDNIDPVVTFSAFHSNGSESHFSLDGSRELPACDNGIVVGLSKDRFTYDVSGLVSSDECYFEIDYLES